MRVISISGVWHDKRFVPAGVVLDLPEQKAHDLVDTGVAQFVGDQVFDSRLSGRVEDIIGPTPLEQARVDGVEPWDSKMSPGQYLTMFPNGDKAECAKRHKEILDWINRELGGE